MKGSFGIPIRYIKIIMLVQFQKLKTKRLSILLILTNTIDIVDNYNKGTLLLRPLGSQRKMELDKG